jgi:hypothetical protein
LTARAARDTVSQDVARRIKIQMSLIVMLAVMLVVVAMRVVI